MNEPQGVAAAVLMKDEADIIEHTIRHLLAQVDHVIAVDNSSTDATREILLRIGSEPQGDRGTLDIYDDKEVGYFQDRKITELAARACEAGYKWFIPCDADEYWYSPFGRIADVLDAAEDKEPQAVFFRAAMLNHVATGEDDEEEENPFRRLRWRLRIVNSLPKIACRLSPALRIGMGNHDAWTTGFVRAQRAPTVEDQLVIHHYPWRSEEQFLRKITNGARAYAATNIGPEYGAHWRAFGMPEHQGFEDRVRGWFREWGYREDPRAEHDEPLIADPPPGLLAPEEVRVEEIA